MQEPAVLANYVIKIVSGQIRERLVREDNRVVRQGGVGNTQRQPSVTDRLNHAFIFSEILVAADVFCVHDILRIPTALKTKAVVGDNAVLASHSSLVFGAAMSILHAEAKVS